MAFVGVVFEASLGAALKLGGKETPDAFEFLICFLACLCHGTTSLILGCSSPGSIVFRSDVRLELRSSVLRGQSS